MAWPAFKEQNDMNDEELVKLQQARRMEIAKSEKAKTDIERLYEIQQIVESRKPNLRIKRDDPPDVKSAIAKEQTIFSPEKVNDERAEIFISRRSSTSSSRSIPRSQRSRRLRSSAGSSPHGIQHSIPSSS